MKIRPAELRRTLQHHAAKQRAYDVVSTREGYDRWAACYDEMDNVLIALEQRELAPRLSDLEGRRALDVGCGTGRWTAQLVERGADVTAVDFSEPMLERARQRPGADAVRFLHHDLARPLPLPDAHFHCVLCGLVLDHIADLELLFGELGRVCAADGEIITSVMHPALMLLGVQAEFFDTEQGRDVRPQSVDNQVTDYLWAAQRAGLAATHLSEHEVDPDLVAHSAKAQHYLGWPLLLLMCWKPTPRGMDPAG